MTRNPAENPGKGNLPEKSNEREVITRKLSVPNAERVFFIRHALRAGFTLEELFSLTRIDRWFLTQLKEIVDFEEELAAAKG